MAFSASLDFAGIFEVSATTKDPAPFLSQFTAAVPASGEPKIDLTQKSILDALPRPKSPADLACLILRRDNMHPLLRERIDDVVLRPLECSQGLSHPALDQIRHTLSKKMVLGSSAWLESLDAQQRQALLGQLCADTDNPLTDLLYHFVALMQSEIKCKTGLLTLLESDVPLNRIPALRNRLRGTPNGVDHSAKLLLQARDAIKNHIQQIDQKVCDTPFSHKIADLNQALYRLEWGQLPIDAIFGLIVHQLHNMLPSQLVFSIVKDLFEGKLWPEVLKINSNHLQDEIKSGFGYQEYLTGKQSLAQFLSRINDSWEIISHTLTKVIVVSGALLNAGSLASGTVAGGILSVMFAATARAILETIVAKKKQYTGPVSLTEISTLRAIMRLIDNTGDLFSLAEQTVKNRVARCMKPLLTSPQRTQTTQLPSQHDHSHAANRKIVMAQANHTSNPAHPMLQFVGQQQTKPLMAQFYLLSQSNNLYTAQAIVPETPDQFGVVNISAKYTEHRVSEHRFFQSVRQEKCQISITKESPATVDSQHRGQSQEIATSNKENSDQCMLHDWQIMQQFQKHRQNFYPSTKLPIINPIIQKSVKEAATFRQGFVKMNAKHRQILSSLVQKKQNSRGLRNRKLTATTSHPVEVIQPSFSLFSYFLKPLQDSFSMPGADAQLRHQHHPWQVAAMFGRPPHRQHVDQAYRSPALNRHTWAVDVDSCEKKSPIPAHPPSTTAKNDAPELILVARFNAFDPHWAVHAFADDWIKEKAPLHSGNTLVTITFKRQQKNEEGTLKAVESCITEFPLRTIITPGFKAAHSHANTSIDHPFIISNITYDLNEQLGIDVKEIPENYTPIPLPPVVLPVIQGNASINRTARQTETQPTYTLSEKDSSFRTRDRQIMALANKQRHFSDIALTQFEILLSTLFPNVFSKDTHFNEIYVTSYDLFGNDKGGVSARRVNSQRLSHIAQQYFERTTSAWYVLEANNITFSTNIDLFNKSNTTEEKHRLEISVSRIFNVLKNAHQASLVSFIQQREVYYHTSPKRAFEQALHTLKPDFVFPRNVNDFFVSPPSQADKLYLTVGYEDFLWNEESEILSKINKIYYCASFIELLKDYRNRTGYFLDQSKVTDPKARSGVYATPASVLAYYQVNMTFDSVLHAIQNISDQYPHWLAIDETPKQGLTRIFSSSLRQLANLYRQDSTLTPASHQRIIQLCDPNLVDTSVPAGVFSICLTENDNNDAAAALPLVGVYVITQGEDNLPETTKGPVLLVCPSMGLMEFSTSTTYKQGIQRLLETPAQQSLLLAHLPYTDRQRILPGLTAIALQHTLVTTHSLAKSIIDAMFLQQQKEIETVGNKTSPDALVNDWQKRILMNDVRQLQHHWQRIQKQKRNIQSKEDAIRQTISHEIEATLNSASDADKQGWLNALQRYQISLLKAQERDFLSIEKYGTPGFLKRYTQAKISKQIMADIGFEVDPNQVHITLRESHINYYPIGPDVSGKARETLGDPIQIIKKSMTLTDLALNNLQITDFSMTVDQNSTTTFPGLTPAYLKDLVRNKINVGGTYPDFIKTELLTSDVAQSRQDRHHALIMAKIAFDAWDAKISRHLSSDYFEILMTAIAAAEANIPARFREKTIEIRQFTYNGIPLQDIWMFGLKSLHHTSTAVLYTPNAPNRQHFQVLERRSTGSLSSFTLTNDQGVSILNAWLKDPAWLTYFINQAPTTRRSLLLASRENTTSHDVTTPLILEHFPVHSYQQRVEEVLRQIDKQTISTKETNIKTALAVGQLLVDTILGLLPFKIYLPVRLVWILGRALPSLNQLDANDPDWQKKIFAITTQIGSELLSGFGPLPPMPPSIVKPALKLPPQYALKMRPANLVEITRGKYQGAHRSRISNQHFIEQKGLVYAVQYDDFHGCLRVADSRLSQSVYKEAIRQNAQKQWEIFLPSIRKQHIPITSLHSTIPQEIAIPMDGITINHMSQDPLRKYTIKLIQADSNANRPIEPAVRWVRYSPMLGYWCLLDGQEANTPVWRIGADKWSIISQSDHIGLDPTKWTYFQPINLEKLLQTESMMTPIPKKIHYVWIGGEIPKYLIKNIKNNAGQSWQYTSVIYVDPDNDHILQTIQESVADKNIPHLLVQDIRQELFFQSFLQSASGVPYQHFRKSGTDFQNLVAASDILRFEIAYRKGGIRMDVDDTIVTKIHDTVLFAAADDILLHHPVTFEYAAFQGYNANIFASHPDNPFFRKIQSRIIQAFEANKAFFSKASPKFDSKNPGPFYNYQKQIFMVTGPKMFDDMLKTEMPDRHAFYQHHRAYLASGLTLPEYEIQLEKLKSLLMPFDPENLETALFPIQMGHEAAMKDFG